MSSLVIGSYNGQDSLGDECLLRAVVERLRHQRNGEPCTLQIDSSDTDFVEEFQGQAAVNVVPSVNAAAIRVTHICNRLGLGDSFGRWLAWALMPLWLRVLGRGAAARKALSDADRVVLFGGTQFSGQWYALNAPAYFYTFRLAKRFGARCFLGPQQFGPLSDKDAAELAEFIGAHVHDWRTRNVRDLELLRADQEAARLVYDEVFSQTRLYPDMPQAGSAAHILVNLRATTFDTNAALKDDRYGALAELIDRLAGHYDLPVVFFGVSGQSFTEDEMAFAAIRARSARPDLLTSVGRVRDEHHLFDLAQRARLTLSMSFHGCILAGIAGAPFIPVTEGRYYDHKYSDFDKYTGEQGVPIISLGGCQPETDAARIAGYVRGFDRSRVSETRNRASALADAFYAEMFTR